MTEVFLRGLTASADRDMGLVFLAHGNHQKGFECFNILAKESNWSKAIYAYAKVRGALVSVSLFGAMLMDLTVRAGRDALRAKRGRQVAGERDHEVCTGSNATDSGEEHSSRGKFSPSLAVARCALTAPALLTQKFVARRARKFISQGNRLCLPAIELAYVRESTLSLLD